MMLNALKDEGISWSTVVIDVQPWGHENKGEERYVWLSCSGLPLHAWNATAFELIGNKVGRFVAVDELSLNREILLAARILVAVKQSEEVKLKLQVEVYGVQAEVAIQEDIFVDKEQMENKEDGKPCAEIEEAEEEEDDEESSDEEQEEDIEEGEMNNSVDEQGDRGWSTDSLGRDDDEEEGVGEADRLRFVDMRPRRSRSVVRRGVREEEVCVEGSVERVEETQQPNVLETEIDKTVDMGVEGRFAADCNHDAMREFVHKRVVEEEEEWKKKR